MPGSHNWALRTVKTAVAMLAFVTVASHFADWHFILDNLSNFPMHYASALLICAAALAAARCGRWLIVCGLALAINLVAVVPWYLPKPEQSGAHALNGFKLLASNVYRGNTDYERLGQLIDEEQPDVVGLVEVTARWLANIPALRRDYPFRFEAPHDRYTGLALYSKLPLTDSQIAYFGDSATPAIVSTMRVPGGDVEVIVAHPLPPMSARLTERRNAQLREIAQHVRASERPILLVGDLNATMWNANYRSFAKHSSLHNARAGYGVGPTWPPVRALGVPIDHIMATTPLQFSNFRVHGSIGSDHLPISVEFSLPDHGAAKDSTDNSTR